MVAMKCFASYLPKVSIWLAWALFIASFFLPATGSYERAGTPPGTPLNGWQAFVMSIEALAIKPYVFLIEPRALLFIAFLIINPLMFLAPVLIFGLQDEAWLLGTLYMAFGIVAWMLPPPLVGDVLFGFYLWNASFFGMGFGCILMGMIPRVLLPQKHNKPHNPIAHKKP
jgi:hypothetical protein